MKDNVMTTSYTYLITHTPTARFYVGKSNTPIGRWKTHLSDCLRGTKCYYIHNAINYYGVEEFEFKVLQEYCSEEEAYAAEDYWIELFDTTNPKFGFNLRRGGKKGAMAEETKHKIRAYRLGKNLSVAAKNKLRVYHLGKIHTEETKRKISIAKKGLPRSKEASLKASLSNLGKKRSTDFKERMRKINLGSKSPSAKLTEENIPTIRRLLQEGLSRRRIAEMFSVSHSTITNIHLGKVWKQVV